MAAGQSCYGYIYLYWLLLVIGPGSVGAVGNHGCPTNCDCNGTATECNLTNPGDYAALFSLDPCTESLICNVNGTFKEVGFGRINLMTLSLRSTKYYPTIQAAVRDNATSEFRRKNLFCNLTSLLYLGINVVTKEFDPELLDCVKKIQTLDLSYSQMTVATSTNVLKHVHENKFPIEMLLMVGTQRRNPMQLPQPIHTRDDIYINVKSLPLKVLYLSQSDAVIIQAGLLLNLPQLEVLRVGANRLLTYDYNSPIHFTEINKIIVDFMLHKHIKEITIVFPRQLPSDRLLAKRDVVKKRTLWYFKFNGTSEDKQIANLEPEVDCLFGFHFPFPRNLERGTFINNRGFIFSEYLKRNTALCFDPSNNLLYLDMSECDLHHLIPDEIGIRGLRKLIYLNLQGTRVTFKTTMSLFSDTDSLEVLLLGGNTIRLDKHCQLDFLHLKTLRVLDMQECGINDIPEHCFEDLENLQFLNISENRLDKFNVNLTGLRHLKFLNLSGNRFRSLDKMLMITLEGFGQKLTGFIPQPPRMFLSQYSICTMAKDLYSIV